MRFSAAVVVLGVLCSQVAAQDSFYPISSVSSSTEADDLWPVSNLIQGPGVGFNASAPYEKTSTDTAGNWVTADPGGFPSDYLAVADQPVLTFDLGGDVSLQEISLWGYSSGNTNGVREFSLLFSTDAEGAGAGAVTAGPFTMLGDPLTGNNDSTTRQDFGFDAVSARYVTLTVLDNFFVAPGDGSTGGLAGGDRVGLGEVAFRVVPEPSALALAGLMLGGFATRRLRRRG